MKNSLTSFLLFSVFALVVSGGSASAAEGGPEFFDDFEKARQASKEAGKPLIAIFSASWCGPCKQMKKNVYPSTEVAPYHGSFIWAYLNADDDKNKSLQNQFGVNGIPHITFVAADGKVIEHARGSVSADSFAKTLTSILEKVGAPVPVATTPAAPAKKGFFSIFKKN